MTTSEFGKAQIALACWRAAKGELHPVMLAVACVLRNRAQVGWYEGDLYNNACGFLNDLEAHNGDRTFPDLRDPQFIQLLSKLDAVTSGLAKDVTDGALYYCPKDRLPEKIEGKITTTIGQTVFLR